MLTGVTTAGFNLFASAAHVEKPGEKAASLEKNKSMVKHVRFARALCVETCNLDKTRLKHVTGALQPFLTWD